MLKLYRRSDIKTFFFALALTVVFNCGIALAEKGPARHVDGCRLLLSKPLKGVHLKKAKDQRRILIDLDKELRRLENEMQALREERRQLEKRIFPRRFIERSFVALKLKALESKWVETGRNKGEIRQRFLNWLDNWVGEDNINFQIVKQILDANIQAIADLQEYIDELKHVRGLTVIALSAEVMGVLATLFVPQYVQYFMPISLFAIVLHSFEVAKVHRVRTRSETELARLRELNQLNPHNEEMPYEFHSKPPSGVLGLAILDALDITVIVERLMDPYSPQDIVGLINSFRLGHSLRRIRLGRDEAQDMIDRIVQLNRRLERDILDEVCLMRSHCD